jgi:hypothetical protein
MSSSATSRSSPGNYGGRVEVGGAGAGRLVRKVVFIMTTKNTSQSWGRILV